MIGKILQLTTLCSILFSMNAFAYKVESKSGPYAVSIESKIFKDIQREDRTVDADIYYPNVDELTLSSMPFIIYSHGFRSNKSEMKSLLKRISSYGYRIVSSNSPYPNETSDLEGKFLDISFIYEYFKVKPSNAIFMGYSLGSLAAIKAGEIHVPALVIAIAPPVHELKREGLDISKRYVASLKAIIGEYDSVAPASLSEAFFENLTGDVEYYSLEKATHLGFLDNGGAFPALTDRVLCRKYRDHYPKGYKCPAVHFGAIKNKEQKLITSDLILSILNNKFLGYD